MRFQASARGSLGEDAENWTKTNVWGGPGGRKGDSRLLWGPRASKM